MHTVKVWKWLLMCFTPGLLDIIFVDSSYFEKHELMRWPFLTPSNPTLCSVSSSVKAAVSGAAAVLSSPSASVCDRAVFVVH